MAVGTTRRDRKARLIAELNMRANRLPPEAFALELRIGYTLVNSWDCEGDD